MTSILPHPFVVLLSLLSFGLSAQNLVLNPSFEAFGSCPLGTSELDNAVDWSNPFINTLSDTCSTSDLFNSCNFLGAFGVGVPANLLGTEAARTGNGYAGIILSEQISFFNCTAFGGSNWREYVQGRLSTPLLAGQTYCVTFYVSLADNVKFATDEFGVFFSNNALTVSCALVGNGPLPSTPQLNWTGGMVTQTNGWTEMQFNYVASGGEEFITIGNFSSDAATNTTCVNGSAFNPYAYYYIDDVSVVSGACSVLPVEISYFSGESLGEQVVLNWESHSESENSAFFLERSPEGKSWTPLAKVSAVPQAYTGASYNWADLNPLPKAYYRLLQQDINGDQRILKTILVGSSTQPTLHINSSNPISNNFRFTLSGIRSAVQFKLVDTQGRTIQATTLQSGTSHTIEISMDNLPAGVYKGLWTGQDLRESRTILLAH